MWLSRKLSQHEMQDVASAQDGTVTIEGGELAVFSSGEKREVKTAAPGGYEWRPRKGENVLVERPCPWRGAHSLGHGDCGDRAAQQWTR